MRIEKFVGIAIIKIHFLEEYHFNDKTMFKNIDMAIPLNKANTDNNSYLCCTNTMLTMYITICTISVINNIFINAIILFLILLFNKIIVCC